MMYYYYYLIPPLLCITFLQLRWCAQLSLSLTSTLQLDTTAAGIPLSSLPAAPLVNMTTTTRTNLPQLDSIRSWGCSRSEMPLVFVHIGKAGGGTIRARITNAAAKSENNAAATTTTSTNISVCNSGHVQYAPVLYQTYEGTRVCRATTPLGQALACPGTYAQATRHECGFGNNNSTNNIIYMGHNGMGSELHWLSSEFLTKWWQQEWSPHFAVDGDNNNNNNNNNDPIVPYWSTLDGTKSWCGDLPRPTHPRILLAYRQRRGLDECVQQHLQPRIDQHAVDLFLSPSSSPTQKDPAQQWSAVYASMPVLRVVLVREPLAWLSSRFAWHQLHDLGIQCDNITHAVGGNSFLDGVVPNELGIYDIERSGAPGWARRLALDHIYQLCGSDCRTRHYMDESNPKVLSEIVRQAEYNLRHTFAVVGVFQDDPADVETFVQMMHHRVEYLDFFSSSNNTPQQTKSNKHSTQSTGDMKRCKHVFRRDTQLREQLVQASPEIAALVHLYRVAERVNAFQRRELSTCHSSSTSHEQHYM